MKRGIERVQMGILMSGLAPAEALEQRAERIELRAEAAPVAGLEPLERMVVIVERLGCEIAGGRRPRGG